MQSRQTTPSYNTNSAVFPPFMRARTNAMNSLQHKRSCHAVWENITALKSLLKCIYIAALFCHHKRGCDLIVVR